MSDTNARQRTLRLALTGTVAASALVAGTAAQAEIFGLMNGRSAAAPAWQTALEAAIQLDDDVRHLAVRGNYALSGKITAFANIGQVDFDDSTLDGLQLGGGVFYHLGDQRVVPSLDIALKPSVGYARLTAGSVDADLVTVGAEALISSATTLGQSSVNWYANVGLLYEYIDFDSVGPDIDDDDIELILGGGITLPAGPGELYAGIDFIDELQFGAGFRYALQ